MRFLTFGLLFLNFTLVFSQETKLPFPMIAVDSLYREDQFYFTFTYNSLLNAPNGITTNKFSPGFKVGFLRDMPLNKQRNVSIAPGFGLSYSNYFQSLFILKDNGSIVYSTNSIANSYRKNKFEQLMVNFPVELRWRTSVPETHKFWRIYSGLQFSYLIYSKSVYEDAISSISISNNKDFNKFQLGVYLAVGYNTWNFYSYYGLTPIFSSAAQLNDERIKMHAIHFGMMFYIL
jgi:Outer membrane protein beta-barrel domain